MEGDKWQKYSQANRLKVLKLYFENCGIGNIEDLTMIRNSQISLWIEDVANYIKKELQKCQNNIHSIKDIAILEIEEESCLYGLLLNDK